MTILYSCIARGTTILVEVSKSYEHNFQQVVGSMMQNLASHDNYKSVYTSSDYLFHVVIKDRICYMCATTVDFRKQTAYSFIMEIMTKVANCSLAQRVHHAGEMELDRDFSSVLGQEMDHFSNLKGGGNDKIAVLQDQVDEVKDIMTQNIDKVLSRGEKLDDLLVKTEDLEASARTFQKTAAKVSNKFWWQNTRMKILLLVVVFVIILVVLLIGLHLGGVI
eukprot:XP_789920.2 PREDICTED: vesicle-associated membrane protein 7 [Strongylocentrotus purpuratus]